VRIARHAVSADETYRSANGNMLSGNAIQNAPSATIFPQSDRNTGFRAEGNNDNVKNPIASRTNVTPPGPIAPNASAINKYDAPQINPGKERITHSAPERPPADELMEFVSFAIRNWMTKSLSLALIQKKGHFGYSRWTAFAGKEILSKCGTIRSVQESYNPKVLPCLKKLFR